MRDSTTSTFILLTTLLTPSLVASLAQDAFAEFEVHQPAISLQVQTQDGKPIAGVTLAYSFFADHQETGPTGNSFWNTTARYQPSPDAEMVTDEKGQAELPRIDLIEPSAQWKNPMTEFTGFASITSCTIQGEPEEVMLDLKATTPGLGTGQSYNFAGASAINQTRSPLTWRSGLSADALTSQMALAKTHCQEGIPASAREEMAKRCYRLSAFRTLEISGAGAARDATVYGMARAFTGTWTATIKGPLGTAGKTIIAAYHVIQDSEGGSVTRSYRATKESNDDEIRLSSQGEFAADDTEGTAFIAGETSDYRKIDCANEGGLSSLLPF